MKHRELIGAIAELEPITVEGVFERHSSLRFEELSASSSGGRWGAPGSYEVLYLGRPRDAVVIEAYRHLVDDELDNAPQLAATVLERRVVGCKISVHNVIDLRPAAAHLAVGLTDTQLRSAVGDYDACQAVGAAVHQLGHAGIVAPSATGIGETLALFPTNLPIDEWPRVIRREIWHGLPPDPRQLRLVNGNDERESK